LRAQGDHHGTGGFGILDSGAAGMQRQDRLVEGIVELRRAQIGADRSAIAFGRTAHADGRVGHAKSSGLSVTLSARREGSIQSDACVSGHARKSLLFKTIADLSHPQLSILLEPWARVGSPSLSLRMPD
jgi:hypothetical protein